MNYPSLSSPVPIKRPFRCMPGVEVIIDDIHSEDPKHRFLKKFKGKKAIVRKAEAIYRRQESYSISGVRKVWVATNLEIDGKIEYFTAVRFHRVTPAQSTFYKNEKHR